MQQNFQTTKIAGLGQNVGPGYPPNASWSNPNNITADDDNDAFLGFFEGGQAADNLVASQFGFGLPDFAVVDGVAVLVDGTQVGCYGDISLNSGDPKSVGAFPQTFGGATDLWGQTSISPAAVNDPSFGAVLFLNDVSGGDGIADINYIEITVFWHIEVPQVPADVPTRIDYKVKSRDGNYLGLLPKVISKLFIPQDINTAGSSIVINCGKFANNEIIVEPLLTQDGEVITTENDLPILATKTDVVLSTGDSPNEAIFKNSNRIEAWVYNKYYPNGKIVYSGEINRVGLKYSSGDAYVRLTVLSDGLDMSNLIARGSPFAYTNDVSQTTSTTYNTVLHQSKGGWDFFGQTWLTGGSVTNLGAISLRLQGTATVTLSIYNAPNGNLIGSVTRNISRGSAGVEQFDFAQLIPVSGNTSYFWAVSVPPGQSIRLYRSGTDVYANGTRYRSLFQGGSGGGSWQTLDLQADYYFVTKSGEPTTTTTYSTQDPVTGTAAGVLADYNARGGLITQRDFQSAGVSLTIKFVVASVLDAIKKVIEVCPAGFYYYVDLGTSQIDIKQTNEMPDFTVVKGRHIKELDIDLTIENVKNYFLFTGGETAGVNLFREYQDTVSSSLYKLRSGSRTDNRVTVTNTADAVGTSFIAENKDEAQETTLEVLDQHIDISLLMPGKTIGFKNFGNFIDGLVLQIVRAEPNYSDGKSNLTLGRLPVRTSSEIQRLMLELQEEQTIKNPSAPS